MGHRRWRIGGNYEAFVSGTEAVQTFLSGDEMNVKRSETHSQEDNEAPAKIHAGHSRRALGVAAGSGKGWRNDAEHPLSLALAKGQLIRGKECHTPRMRIDAGDLYRVVV